MAISVVSLTWKIMGVFGGCDSIRSVDLRLIFRCVGSLLESFLVVTLTLVLHVGSFCGAVRRLLCECWGHVDG